MVQRRFFLSLLLVAAGCGGGNGTPVDQGPTGDAGLTKLTITIVTPADGAKDVPVSGQVFKASFNRDLASADGLKVTLLKGSTTLYGVRKYSATNLEMSFTPFNLLQTRSSYTLVVAAEGVEARSTFTTAKANEGTLPPIADKTYDFRLKKITYPEELAGVFNSQLAAAPPVLMHVATVKDEGVQDGNSLGSLLIVGSTGKPGDPAGQAKVPPEDATRLTTTAMAIEGRMEGAWFGAGPSDLHTTASGVALVIRDFYVTGVFSADGTVMQSVILTGLIDPIELGEPLKVDLSFICKDVRFSKFCDSNGRIRVAATVDTVANPIPFTGFITKPINNSVDVDPSGSLQAYFSEEIDQTTTAIKLRDAANADVPGKVTFDGKKTATFKPDAALGAKAKYTIEAAGTAKNGGATDTRHATFTTN
jgi:hypothetical protein